MKDFYWDNFLLNSNINEQIYLIREGIKYQITGESNEASYIGKLYLTNYNIVYKDSALNEDLIVPLANIVYSEIIDVGLSKTLVMHMNQGSLITFEFSLSGLNEFYRQLQVLLSEKAWLIYEGKSTRSFKKTLGITGIEKNYMDSDLSLKGNLSKAFYDLKSLQNQASETLDLCRTISKQIIDKTGNLSEDEIVQFKTHLLNLGLENEELFDINLDDKATKQNYHMKLAKEIIHIILPILQQDFIYKNKVGKVVKNKDSLYNGYMTVPEAFCRINRARGLDLVSPEDMIKACHFINNYNKNNDEISLLYKVFDDGLSVLCLNSLFALSTGTDISAIMKKYNLTNALFAQIFVAMQSFCKEIINYNESIDKAKLCISVEDFARYYSIPVFVAKDKLLECEKFGELCRDDSIEGLKFYINLF